ncbi:hypothetical protein SK128_015647, partial [Halocaridina rubra]
LIRLTEFGIVQHLLKSTNANSTHCLKPTGFNNQPDMPLPLVTENFLGVYALYSA